MYEVEMVIKESIPTQWGLNSLHAVRNIGLNRIIGLQVGMGGGIPCFGVGRVCERKKQHRPTHSGPVSPILIWPNERVRPKEGRVLLSRTL